MEQKKRLSGPDLIRCICALFVVMEHFFLNTGYYDEPLVGSTMFIQTFFRWMFLVCIPMYMMLSGYFKSNKQIEKSHYMSLIPIVAAYVVVSVPKMILYNRLYGPVYGIKEGLKSMGDYSMAWYAGFYIALMILAPFLNKLWKSLEGKKEQNALIISLVILCSIYPLFHYIVPSFFINLYPIMYYYIGIYIKENKPKFNKIILLIIFLITICLETVISFFGAKGGTFNWNLISTVDTGFGGLFIAISSVCVFLMLHDIDIKNAAVCGLLKRIGSVTFETYLFAGAYDAIIYYYLKRTVIGSVNCRKFFPVTTLLSFSLAVISAIIFKYIYGAAEKIISRKK